MTTESIIGEYALQALLLDYSRQLQEGLDAAESGLALLVSPTMTRRWLPPTGISLVPHFFSPNENTPPDQWYWAEEKEIHPALLEIKEVIQRFDDFATEYRNRVERAQCANGATQPK